MSQQSAKERAEAYVREQLPELMELSFGCEVTYKTLVDMDASGKYFEKKLDGVVINPDIAAGSGKVYVYTPLFGEPDYIIVEKLVIIGHPIHLQHWLRVLGEADTAVMGNLHDHSKLYEVNCILGMKTSDSPEKFIDINFNLTTGQPATEEDYQAFYEIVGVGN